MQNVKFNHESKNPTEASGLTNEDLERFEMMVARKIHETGFHSVAVATIEQEVAGDPVLHRAMVHTIVKIAVRAMDMIDTMKAMGVDCDGNCDNCELCE